MTKNKTWIFGIIAVLLLAITAIFIWKNYEIAISEKTDKPAQSPSLPPQTSLKCGIENCHGLDITCGPNIAEVCTEIYMAGDNCRRYASCQITNGQCKLEKTQKFDNCKACVEKCEIDDKDNPMEFFQCESKCAE